MSRGGKVDLRELKKFKEKLEKLEMEEFLNQQAKQLAQRLISLTKRKTPVDTGHLRRNWAMGSIEKVGKTYIVTISNNVEYASLVENGHRNKSHKGWVSGRFMLKISENELQEMAPQILQRNLKKFLKEAFHE